LMKVETLVQMVAGRHRSYGHETRPFARSTARSRSDVQMCR
jgi:hypothetical protein